MLQLAVIVNAQLAILLAVVVGLVVVLIIFAYKITNLLAMVSPTI